MNDALVVVERRPPLLVVELNRPARRNALDDPLRNALIEVFEQVRRDAEVRAVVVAGRGQDFCAGGDLDRLAALSPLQAAWPATRVDLAIERCGRPVVAALHGNVLGGGLEMALACTMRMGAEDLRCGLPEVRLGVLPGLGATQRLPRLVGEAVALDLVLTGRSIAAGEALRLGIVTRVVPASELHQEAIALGELLARRPPHAVRAAIDAVRRSFDLSRDDGFEYERHLLGLLCTTEDRDEGIAAWRERRPPEFQGR